MTAYRPIATAVLFVALSASPLPIANAQQAQIALPPVDIVAASPLLGSGIDRNKAPAATSVLNSGDINRSGIPSALGALDAQVPGVALDDAQGNPFQPNLIYRGFSASPLNGNPQGLAVYVNGVRFNQPFGDAVSWDLLPSVAIDQMNLEGSNPVFGLNALGGALSVQMKSGFTWKGINAETIGGSFGTVGGNFQYGKRSGDTAAYLAGNLLYSDGWRQINTSDVRQIYGDIGWRGRNAELHLNILLADNILNAPGTVPVQLLDADRAAAFTAPDRTTNKFGLFSLSGSIDITDATSLQVLVYYDNFSQRITNSNTPIGQPCATNPGSLCTESGDLLYGLGGNPISNLLNGGPYANSSSEGTNTNGYGAALQISDQRPILGLHNQLTAGLSLDGGITTFTASNAIGGITSERVFVGPGIVIDQPDGSIAPVRVGSTNTYYGAYVADTLDLTPTLSLSLSGRMNVALVVLNDQNGTELNGYHSYSHFNPGIGLTWRAMPALSFYASWSEANRAPTPAELSCANPLSPCTLANFFVGDPNLQQVVAQTFEAGMRGRLHPAIGTLDWNLGVFRTNSNNEILQVASAIPGLDFFQNVGHTLRQGIEAGLTLSGPRYKVWFGYAYTNATFESALTLDSPLNPGADANGQIHVMPGDHLPGVPTQQLKLGFDYAVTSAWTIGATAIASTGQYLSGDEANLTPKTGAYVVLNLNTSYQVTPAIRLLALVQNALNAKYETFGTFSATSAIPIAQAPGATITRSLSPAQPIAAFGGITVTF